MSDDAKQEKPKSLLDSATILCVDDEENILKSLKRTFRKHSYIVLTANSAKEGLEILSKKRIDLVISDMRMPEMDGAEFLKIVQEKYPHAARILLTGYADIESTVKAVNEGGISSYISKPWDDQELNLTVRSTLKVHFLEMERKRLLAMTHRQNKSLEESHDKLQAQVKQRTMELEQISQMLQMDNNLIQESYHNVVKVLSHIVGLRENMLGSVTTDIAHICEEIGKQVNLSEDEIKDLYYAGLLFEVGKLGLSDELLATPLSEMDKKKKEQFFQYAAMSEASLFSVGDLERAAIIIRDHCEYYDGTGFPRKIAINEISIPARILSMTKDFFLYQTGRIDGTEHTLDEAREYMKSQSGKHYDPNLVPLLLDEVASLESHQQNKVAKLSCDELEPGMTLSRDCVSDNGLMLLSKGVVLNSAMITKLKSMQMKNHTDLDVYVHKQ